MDVQSTILVVDDQERGRLALEGLLEQEGYRIALAASGPEALAQIQLHAPDLVLLDVMMPEMDGFEVCRRIRADPALALIPVVMVTALDDHASLVRGIEAGADDVLTKPFNRVELRARVRTITRLNRFRTLLDEQRRAASERAQLLWAIERSSDGYLLLDQDDRPQGGNSQGWRFLGLTAAPQEGLAEPLLDAARRLYRLEPAEAWASWPAPSGATRYLVRAERANSLWIKVELLDLPLGWVGQRMVHLQDVTAIVSAQRDIWTFHSFISHKLRTPLTSLLAGMGLLHRQAERLPADLAMLSETAYNGAHRLKQVVDDIFNYIEAPALGAAGEGAPLAEVPAVVARLGADMGIARLAVDPCPDPGARRLAVSARTLELVLTELLENARKFHPRGEPAVLVAVRCAGGQATISLSDDGQTLTALQLRQIWEPYQQLDSDFTGQVPGIGLGLATVAQVCWAAGGTCRLANRPDGPGLIVELALPLSDEAPYHEAQNV